MEKPSKISRVYKSVVIPPEIKTDTMRLDYFLRLLEDPKEGLRVKLFVVEMGRYVRGQIGNENGSGLVLSDEEGNPVSPEYRVGNISFF